MAKIMISLPDDLLGAVDAAAEQASLTRSAFVREALIHRLAAGRDPERRSRAWLELRRSLNGGDWNAEELVRAERER